MFSRGFIIECTCSHEDIASWLFDATISFFKPIVLYYVFWFGGHVCGVVCTLEVHVAMYRGHGACE